MRDAPPAIPSLGSTPLRALAVLLLLGLTTGCAAWTEKRWTTTRQEVVNPIHELLHHAYPEALEAGDPDRLATLFGGPTAAAAQEPSRALLARFASIADARADIDHVDLDAEPVQAWVRLQVEGTGPDGAPRTIRQEKTWTLGRHPGGWHIAGDAAGPMRVVPTPPAYFTEETQLRGIWFEHQASELPDAAGKLQKHVFGSGVAAADVDGDGWDDVFLLTGTRIDLFRNREGYFVRESETRGLGAQDAGVLTVALPVDLDNDGWKDLFVGAELGQPLLFRNEGGHFTRVADAGLRTSERTISAVAADFDGNGFADLYLANHEDVFLTAPEPPGAADNAQPDQLFLNDGGWRFRDATAAARLGNTGWSLTPLAADYDGDGDVDLFVGNDFGTDKLYRNDGAARFEEVSDDAGVDKPVASMGADWGDFDGDGDLDLFIGGMFSGSGWVLEVPEFQIRRVPRIVDVVFRRRVRAIVRSWFRGNRLYENQGDGTFREIAAGSGAETSYWSWASVWLDFDNDGRLDVYGVNGFLSGPLEDDL